MLQIIEISGDNIIATRASGDLSEMDIEKVHPTQVRRHGSASLSFEQNYDILTCETQLSEHCTMHIANRIE